MESIRVIIADDCDTSRKLLNKLIKAIPEIHCVGEARNGEELLSKVLVEEPDLLLVDVTMPIMNGIEAVKNCMEILPHLKAIFITGHDQYALDAFNVSAIDYIVKPIDQHRLMISLKKAVEAILLRKQQDRANLEHVDISHLNLRKLICRYEGAIYYIGFNEIIFIEKQGRKALIHTLGKKIELNETISSLKVRLDARFIQSHRSYILNIEYLFHIKNIGDSYLASFNNYSERAYVSKNNFQRVANYMEKIISRS